MRRHWLFLAVLLPFTVSGCTPSPAPVGPTANSQDKGTIGFSALEMKNPFFKIIADSLTEEAEKAGYKVVVNDAERDVNKQTSHIENYIAQGVTAIVINPADRTAIGSAIKKANEAGVPVFTCDLQCVAENAEVAAHVGTDNYQGGKLAGEAMIEALGETGGKVLILHFKQANSCVLRVQGFTEVIDAHNKGRDSGTVEIVAELEGGGLRDESLEATSAALQTYMDLAGVFCINDPSALGAYDALEQANRQDQVKIIGFDGQIEGKQAIKDGKIYADPIQFPRKMGQITFENITKYLNGEEFETVQLIPTEIYKQADGQSDPELN